MMITPPITTTPPTPVTLYVHAGIFHADDVFCAAYLKLLGFEPEVHRVTEITEEMLAQAAAGEAIIADIGQQYDPAKNLYDHHQDDAPERQNGIKYAGFGLLVKNLWREEWDWQELFDREIVQPVDAADNGQGVHAVNKMIKAFVPNWNSEESMDEAFAAAVDFAYGILTRDLARRIAIRDARDIALAAAGEAQNGVVLLDKYVPFDGCLDGSTGCKAVVYPSLRGGYDCRILPIRVGSRELVGSFHKLRAGIKGCTFVHQAGFLASFETLEQALAACKSIF